jgi:hypothetical protein
MESLDVDDGMNSHLNKQQTGRSAKILSIAKGAVIASWPSQLPLGTCSSEGTIPDKAVTNQLRQRPLAPRYFSIS